MPTSDSSATRSETVTPVPSAIAAMSTEEFLSMIGQRVRRHRTARRMSRKALAESSQVSERYLAQLEAGQGNMSIALLRRVAQAIQLPLGELMSEPGRAPVAPSERLAPLSMNTRSSLRPLSVASNQSNPRPLAEPID